MHRFPSPDRTSRDDGLRLLALGRVPRCGSCPRYHGLVALHAAAAAGRRALPEVPADCSYQFCAPLARRYEAPGVGTEQLGARAGLRLAQG